MDALIEVKRRRAAEEGFLLNVEVSTPHQNERFSDTQEQQKAFLEAQDACKISAWVVGFRLTIPRLSDQSTDA